MAKPTTRKGRKDIENSGYYRSIAIKHNDTLALEMAKMFSAMQSIVISNGNDLDSKIIPDARFNKHNPQKSNSSKINHECIGHFFKFKVMKEDCTRIKKTCIEIDYLTVDSKRIRIFEIKDGDNFDTKKSEGEIESLTIATNYFKERFPDHDVTSHVVMWNASDVNKTLFKVKGLPSDCLMTGKHFCELIDLPFEEIVEYKKNQQQSGVSFEPIVKDTAQSKNVKAKPNSAGM
jgi:hypothetical protein